MKKTFFLLYWAVASCGGTAPDVSGSAAGGPNDGKTDAGGDVPSWPVPGQRNARGLRSEGPYLYWLVDEPGFSVLKRCEKRDCRRSQTSVARFAFTGNIMGFEIRGETLYAVARQAIFRCPLDNCSEPKTIGPTITPIAVAFDDDNVYWSTRAEKKIFSCPLAGCTQPIRTLFSGTLALDLAVDATRLYWIAGDGTYPHPPVAVFSAPKDGSGEPTALAARQNQASALTVHDGFVYWATSYTLGAVARCAITGCPGGEPELLAERQYFPLFVNPAAGAVFWMNGAGAVSMVSTIERPVQILGCQLGDCAATTVVLGEGNGGGFGVRANAVWKPFEGEALAAREMVVDDEAVYWFGDVVNAMPSAPLGSQTDATIRKTER
jgi:hypothetical protein